MYSRGSRTSGWGNLCADHHPCSRRFLSSPDEVSVRIRRTASQAMRAVSVPELHCGSGRSHHRHNARTGCPDGSAASTLEPTKTKLVEFGRFAQKHAGKRGRNRPETIYFLGLTLYCTHAHREISAKAQPYVSARANAANTTSHDQ